MKWLAVLILLAPLAACGSSDDEVSRAEVDATQANVTISRYCLHPAQGYEQMLQAVDTLVASYRQDPDVEDTVKDATSILDGCDDRQARKLERELR